MWLMNNSEATPAPAVHAPKLNMTQPAEQTPGGASFSEFKLDLNDEKAA
jgi:hypothetical protein